MSGLEGLAPPPCGQLTRCFPAVAELLVTNIIGWGELDKAILNETQLSTM